MKKSFLIAIFAFGMNAKAQITYEASYPMSSFMDNLYILRLESSGDKYCKIDNANNKINLYNLNHSFFKQITIPVQIDTFGYYIMYVAEKLFDNDSTDIDYLLFGCSSGCGSSPPYTPPYVRVYNENGTILFSKDTAQIQGIAGLFGQVDDRPTIFNTDSGAKMVLLISLIWPPFLPSNTLVYGLPAKLHGGNCINSIGNGNIISNSSKFISYPYPNPTSTTTRVNYQLPEGVNEGEVVLYDLIGKELRRYRVDRTFDHLLLSAADLPAGTYFYQLQTSKQNSEGKKMVVIK